MLDDPDSKVRTSAASALKKFGKAAHAPMLEAYREANARARFVLLSALGKINAPAISELLIAALDDQQTEIRLEAARVLGVRKDRRAVPRLLQLVADGGTYLLNAAWSLARQARASGDLGTLAQAAFAARGAQSEHRSRLETIRNGECAGDVDGDRQAEGTAHDLPSSSAGLEVIRKLESVLRDLGRTH